MNILEKKLAEHNIKFSDFESTMERVAVTAIENNLTNDFNAAFKLMLEKDRQFLCMFGKSREFRASVTEKMAETLHLRLNATLGE